MKKRIQVTAPGGIHAAVAVLLSRIVIEENAFIFIKTDRKMVSVREHIKVLSLGIHQYDWIDIIVDGEQDEKFIMSQVERILCGGSIEEGFGVPPL